MILDRLEFLKAVKFLKHAISENEDTGSNNCLHLRVEQDRCILTAHDSYKAKKVVLIRPVATEEMVKEDKHFGPESFLIPRPTLISFETLMDKHKKKAKKLAKNDESYLYISVSMESLESFGIEILNKQPACEFKNFEGLFEHKREAIPEIGFIPGDTVEIMAGFDKSQPVKLSFAGPQSPIHFYQESTEFEAVLLPVPLNQESIGEDEKKQTNN